MIKRIAIIVLFAVVITGLSFLFLNNTSLITVTYAPDKTFSAPVALQLIISFGIGCLIACFISLLVETKTRLENRRLTKQLKTNKQISSSIEQARERIALGNFALAESELQKIINKNPDLLDAQILLATCVRLQGFPKKALSILDAIRVEKKQNVELLLLASDLNIECNNYTAAYDNAALTLQLKPHNLFALKRVVKSCLALNKLEDALQYQTEISKHTSGAEYELALRELASIKFKNALKTFSTNRTELKTALEKILDQHRDFSPALAELAKIEAENSRRQAASKLFKKAYNSDNKLQYLSEICKLWLDANEPGKALAELRSAIAVTNSTELIPAKLFLIKQLLDFEMIEDANWELKQIADSPQLTSDKSLKQSYLAIKARLLLKQEQLPLAFDLLMQNTEEQIDIPELKQNDTFKSTKKLDSKPNLAKIINLY
jgi:tetratricopeptide (TPR) repeat protein